MGLNPREHLTQLKGKDYLPVWPRVALFREVCPIEQGWSIHTEMLSGGETEDYAVFKASIINQDGVAVGHGTKSETRKGFGDFIEKAETGAVGRALAMCGFGTLYATSVDTIDDPVDAPAERRQAQQKPKQEAKPVEKDSGHEEVRLAAVALLRKCKEVDLTGAIVVTKESMPVFFGIMELCEKHGKNYWEATLKKEKPEVILNLIGELETALKAMEEVELDRQMDQAGMADNG